MHVLMRNLIWVVIAAALAGCAGQGHSTAKKAVPPISRPSLPLDAYSVDHAGLLYKTRVAEDRLIRTCMKRRGIAWNPPPISRRDARPPFGRYGLVDADVAKSWGYHDPIDPVRERRNHYFMARMTRRQHKELDGRHGCRARADDVLYRGVTADTDNLVFRLSSLSWRKAQRSRAVIGATRRWSACMRIRGYRYRTPEAAQADKRWHLEKPTITRTENATAVADVSCKRRVSFVRVCAGQERRTQRRLIRRYSKRLGKIRKANTRQLANVNRRLG